MQLPGWKKNICHVLYCRGDGRKSHEYSSDLFHGGVRVLTVTTCPIPKSSFYSQMGPCLCLMSIFLPWFHNYKGLFEV